MAIYLVRENCSNFSFPMIGKEFGGRDHTTIMHSYEKIADEVKNIPDTKATITRLQELIDE